MFSFNAGLEIKGDTIYITGVSFDYLSFDMKRFYGTSALGTYMLRRESRDTISTKEFFLVELHYVISKLLQLRNIRSNRKRLVQLRGLIEEKTWFSKTLTPQGKIPDLKDLKKYFHKVPFEKQRTFLEQYNLIKSTFNLKGLLLDGVAGSGKAQPLSSLIKTPHGWTSMGEIKVGDTVLTPKNTSAKVTSIHPQGVTPVFEFRTEDDRTVKSHPEHLWDVIIEHSNGKSIVVNRERKTVTTQYIIDNFKTYRFYLPVVGKLDGPRQTNINIDATVIELIEENKLISCDILEMSYENRFRILQNIMDNYGRVVGGRLVCFEYPSMTAADNVRQLVWSLGGVAKLTKTTQTCRVSIKHTDLDNLFANHRDLENVPTTHSLHLKVQITQIKKCESEPTQCITIDDPDHLYITDDYLVTHNTYTSILWTHILGKRKTLVLCPMNTIENVWETQLEGHYKDSPKVWLSTHNKPLTAEYDYYVVHYDYISGGNYAELVKFIENTIRKTGEQFNLVVDESHNFADHKSLRSKRLIDMADRGYFIDALCMSGTPLKNASTELYTVFCVIDPLFVGRAREDFLRVYGKAKEKLNELMRHRIGRSKFTIPEINGMGEPDETVRIPLTFKGADKYTLDALRMELQEYINERMVFYRKNMVDFLYFYTETVKEYQESIKNDSRALEELERYKAIVHKFRTQGYAPFEDMDNSKFAKEVEEKIESRLRGKDLKAFRNVKSAVKYLNLKVRGEALGHLGRLRMAAVRDIIEHVDLPKYIDHVEKKTVIYTSYVDVLKETEFYLQDKGYNVVAIYGDNNSSRDATVKDFMTNPTVNPLVTTFSSLKEGTSLTAANQIIMLNAPWRDYEIVQVKARIWRYSQDSKCFFWLVDLDTGDKQNITSRTINILEWSKEQVDQLVDREDGNLLFKDLTGTEEYEIPEEYEEETPAPHWSTSVLSLFG